MRRKNSNIIYMEVKIIKSKLPTYWYSELIGNTFKVKELWGGYVLCEDYDNSNGDWRHIDKQDCEIVR